MALWWTTPEKKTPRPLTTRLCQYYFETLNNLIYNDQNVDDIEYCSPGRFEPNFKKVLTFLKFGSK